MARGPPYPLSKHNIELRANLARSEPPEMAVFLYPKTKRKNGGNLIMGFFSSAVSTLQTLVVALGAGLGVWGVVNLLEGYGSDNPGAKSQGMKQLMAGGGIILLGITLISELAGLF